MMSIGDCRYDPDTGTLLDGSGRAIPLRRKSAAVLAVLAESPGLLVEKNAILARVWAGLIVSDEGLSQCVRDIRKAIGDDARRIVKTVPGRGFLLVAEASDAPGPETEMPVIRVDEIGARSGGIEAEHLGERIRQEILRSISRRSGNRISSGRSGAEAADHVIRGTVSRRGNGFSAFLEIEETGGRGTFFAEDFDCIDEPQDDFARRVARKVTNVQRVSAIAHFGKRLLPVPDERLNLQQLLQKAAYHSSRITVEDSAAAERVLRHAVSRYPDNSMALAMLAACHAHLYPLVAIDRSEERVAETMEFAERAVHTGPDVDFALRTRGNLKFWLMRDVDGAEADCQRALSLSPNYQLAHLTRIQIDLFDGDITGARERFERHIEVDIALPQYHYFQTLLALFAIGERRAAVAQHHAREAFDIAPWSDWGVLVMACAHGEATEALPRAIIERAHTMRLSAAHFTELPSRTPDFVKSLRERASRVIGNV